MKTVFLRALEVDDKAAALRTAIREPETTRGTQRFEVDAASFAAVPRSPFTYWVTDRLRQLFVELPSFASGDRIAKHGAATLDDVRFVRLWFEVQNQRSVWVPFAKGGTNSPFYCDVSLILKWSHHGSELKANASAVRSRNGWGEHWTAVLNGYSHYFRPGITWPHRSATFSAAALPTGCVFSQSGKAAFVPQPDLGMLLGLFNGSIMTTLARIQSDAVRIKFESGLVERTPFPSIAAGEALDLARLARHAWSCTRSLDTCVETSHAFTLPALLQVKGETLTARAAAWSEQVRCTQINLTDTQAEIDERCFALYDINEDDCRVMTEGAGSATDEPNTTSTRVDTETDNETLANNDEESTLAAELVSWAVGVAVGRFDVRLATGDRPLPDEPEPFDPLPACSPAMLTGDDDLPLASPPAEYPVDFPENGILVDDPGHLRDLLHAVETVFDAVFGDRAEAMLHEAASLLDPKGHDLRAWLAADFFEYHLKRYSKSRRKAPILWQLGVPSGRFSVWLYAHRLARDTFFQIRHDVVEPKLLYEERQLADLVENAGIRPSAKQRREIAAQEEFIAELRIMLEEVKRLAPEWNPTLDDGVALTMAPLWRLVPQHKAWQRELKGKWEELENGRYDWAHIAMRHWPERVTAKCATDHSLAIAHGLGE